MEILLFALVFSLAVYGACHLINQIAHRILIRKSKFYAISQRDNLQAMINALNLRIRSKP